MENQHRLIKTYRDLSQTEIDLINKIKVHEAQQAVLLNEVNEYLHFLRQNATDEDSVRIVKACPNRWLAISQTHFDQAFMALVRSVAQPLPPELEPV